MSDRLEQIDKAFKHLEESDRKASENFAKEVEGLDPRSEEYQDKLWQLMESENARWKMRQYLREEKEEIIEHEKEVIDKSSVTIPLEEYNRLQNELRIYKKTDEVMSQIVKEIVENFDEHKLEKLNVRTVFDAPSFTLHIQVR